jgi:hypothetical protein
MNYIYNDATVVRQLEKSGVAGAKEAFEQVQLVVNSIAFPAGMTIVSVLALPVAKLTSKQGKSDKPEDVERLRQRSLRLGEYTAYVSLAAWLIAGVVYPVAIHLLVGGLDAANGLRLYGHFFLSMVLCGTIAVAYAYLQMAYVCIRVAYPALLAGSTALRDERELFRVSWWSGASFWSAVAVPTVATIVLGAAAAIDVSPAAASNAAEWEAYVAKFAPLAVSLISLLGLFAAWFINRAVQQDAAALIRASAPVDTFGMATDTVDSFA